MIKSKINVIKVNGMQKNFRIFFNHLGSHLAVVLMLLLLFAFTLLFDCMDCWPVSLMSLLDENEPLARSLLLPLPNALLLPLPLVAWLLALAALTFVGAICVPVAVNGTVAPESVPDAVSVVDGGIPFCH